MQPQADERRPVVLALDLARRMGWAEGHPGDVPRVGTVELAREGASHAAIHGGMIKWLGTRLLAFQPSAIVFEAPIPPPHMRGKTNFNTTRVLLGLAAVVEGVCFCKGVHNLTEASVGDVRMHLLGRRPPAATAKQQVISRVRMLGVDTKDPDAADAAALWFYQTSIMYPRWARALDTPLFRKGSR